ncbi:uncharacterized protein [Odocoileus virginianus]|uniref:Collagen alpha-1(I) chain-like n=1 Tax=Odocoileus virginianus TaxID=9874 RepID=A0ABM4IA02_ODOVR
MKGLLYRGNANPSSSRQTWNLMKVDTSTLKFASHHRLPIYKCNRLADPRERNEPPTGTELLFPVSHDQTSRPIPPAQCAKRSPRRLAESCADSDSEVRARARAPGAVQLGLAPAGLRYQHATTSEIKNFDRPPGVLLRAPDPRPSQKWGRGCQQPCTPQLPSPNPGRRSHLPLGSASRCRRASGRVRRALSLGGKKREKPCRRSARAHSPPPLRITAGGEAGSGAARRGGSGEVEAQSAQLPSLDPKGTQNAGWRKAGGGSCALGGVGGRGAPPSPWASTIVWALGSPLAPQPRFSAPHPARLRPLQKKAEGAAGAETYPDQKRGKEEEKDPGWPSSWHCRSGTMSLEQKPSSCQPYRQNSSVL